LRVEPKKTGARIARGRHSAEKKPVKQYKEVGISK
jgi:hypothetical protein